MIPIKDNIPSRTTPYVNYALIALTAIAFLVQLSSRDEATTLIERFGMIPARISQPGEPVQVPEQRIVRTPYGLERAVVVREAAPAGVPVLLTLLTCVFLHGGWMHFLGNMWFLYIFGDNVEDRFGHLKYLFFYLLGGLAASAAHLLTNWSSPVPTIGASGAVAGVMGAYFLLYPRATVIAIIPIFFFLQIMTVPAPLFLGIWFLIQFFQGTFSIADVQATGVAWWAHIGGFVFGFLAVFLFRHTHSLRAEVEERLPGSAPFHTYRRGWRHWE